MKYRLAIYCIALLVLAGCGRQTEEKESTGTASQLPEMQAPPLSPAMRVVSGEVPSDAVIVDVNGKKLTVGEANMLMDFRLSSIINQIPPTQLDGIKANMLKGIAENFVQKTLLMDAADEKNIEVAEDEKQAALDEIAAKLPPGVDIEQAMNESPWGRDKLMQEMEASIKMKKLLEPLGAQEMEVSDEEIDEFYEANRDRLDKPERIRASHILIKTEPTDTPEQKAEKKKKLEGIRQEIVDGADFAEKAKEHSACGSGKMGGDLGEFHRESPLAPEFKDAAFAQAVDEIGPVFETSFGYHIIKVTGHKDAEKMSRDKIREIVMSQKRQNAVKDYIEDLRSQAEIKYEIEL